MASSKIQCRQCGAYQVYRSASRNLAEKYLLPALLLRPVRCGHCFRRSYRPIFQAPQRKPQVPAGKRAA